MKFNKTHRGFDVKELQDKYGNTYTVQQSSGNMSDYWVGIDNPRMQILSVHAHALGIKGGTPYPNGWIEYKIPKEVLVESRMLLSQKQIKELIGVLQATLKKPRKKQNKKNKN